VIFFLCMVWPGGILAVQIFFVFIRIFQLELLVCLFPFLFFLHTCALIKTGTIGDGDWFTNIVIFIVIIYWTSLFSCFRSISFHCYIGFLFWLLEVVSFTYGKLGNGAMIKRRWTFVRRTLFLSLPPPETFCWFLNVPLLWVLLAPPSYLPPSENFYHSQVFLTVLVCRDAAEIRSSVKVISTFLYWHKIEYQRRAF